MKITKKMIYLIMLASLLTGCGIFRVHKMPVEQGNVVTEQNMAKIRLGMSETRVREIMGEPVMSNLFAPNDFIYIYTYQSGYEKMLVKKLVLTFRNGILVKIG